MSQAWSGSFGSYGGWRASSQGGASQGFINHSAFGGEGRLAALRRTRWAGRDWRAGRAGRRVPGVVHAFFFFFRDVLVRWTSLWESCCATHAHLPRDSLKHDGFAPRECVPPRRGPQVPFSSATAPCEKASWSLCRKHTSRAVVGAVLQDGKHAGGDTVYP